MREIICKTCGKLFLTKSRHLECNFCQHKKSKHPCLDCGKNIWHKSIRCISCEAKNRVKKHIGLCGNPLTIEIKRKIGYSNSGKKSNFWKGGLTNKNRLDRNSSKHREWRKLVFERDNWTCQECKKHGGNLDPHHIKPFSQYPKLRFNVDNGQTLCHKCHKKTKSYGYNQKIKAL